MEVNGNVGKKQVSINMIANIVSYSSNILISFVLTPFLINTLGKETYSFYPIANNIVSYMSIISNSMNTMASRFVTVSLVKGDIKESQKYYSSVMAANTIIGAVLLVPMLICVGFLDRFMEIPINSVAAVKALFVFVFASTLVNVVGSIFGIATFAKNRIDLRSLRELITAILRLVLFVVLYKFFLPSIVYVGIVALVVSIVNILIQYKYKKILLPEIRLSKDSVSEKHTRELLGSSVWNMINTLGSSLLAGMSLILSNIFYGASASGNYSIVSTVPGFINGVISLLVGVFYPVLMYLYAENKKDELIKEVIDAQKIIGMVACATIVVFSALSPEFFSLWTPGEDSNDLALLSCISIVPHFAIACLWSLTNLNVVMNKVKVPALFTLGLGVANVFIAFILYKATNMGMISLAITSSALQIIWIGILIPQYSCRQLDIKWNTFYTPLVRAFLCAIPTIITVLVVKKLFLIDSWLKFITLGAVMGTIGLLIFAFGMLGHKNIKKYVSRAIKIKQSGK